MEHDWETASASSPHCRAIFLSQKSKTTAKEECCYTNNNQAEKQTIFHALLLKTWFCLGWKFLSRFFTRHLAHPQEPSNRSLVFQNTPRAGSQLKFSFRVATTHTHPRAHLTGNFENLVLRRLEISLPFFRQSPWPPPGHLDPPVCFPKHPMRASPGTQPKS